MVRLIISRLVQAVTTLVVVSFAVFALAHATGNPVNVMLPIEATIEEREALAEHLGLNDPFLEQYWRHLTNAVQGDFGDSIRTGEPASELVLSRIGTSLVLGSLALVVTLLIGIPLGVLGAVKRGRWLDKAAMALSLGGQAVPVFWVAPIAVLIFSVRLGWLPTSGLSSWRHYVLPVLLLSWGIAAGIVRLLRSTMLEVFDSEYIKLARSKGLGESVVVWKHALRNGLIPVVTLIGLTYGHIVTGVVIIEVIFAVPGLGRLGYDAVQWRDFPVLQLASLVFVFVIVFVNFLVDLSYGIIDPRARSPR